MNNAIGELVPIIANAPADAKTRDAWLERLFEAYQADGIPYIEWLGDHWGTLCASKEVGSRWADRLIDTAKLAWSPDPNLRGYFKGSTNCHDVLALLELAPHKMWHCRQFGVKALAAKGKKAEAIRYAEEDRRSAMVFRARHVALLNEAVPGHRGLGAAAAAGCTGAVEPSESLRHVPAWG